MPGEIGDMKVVDVTKQAEGAGLWWKKWKGRGRRRLSQPPNTGLVKIALN